MAAGDFNVNFSVTAKTAEELAGIYDTELHVIQDRHPARRSGPHSASHNTSRSAQQFNTYPRWSAPTFPGRLTAPEATGTY